MAERRFSAIAHGYAERETCARASSWLTLILTLPWSALDTGQRSSARPTIRSNFPASSPGTTARTDRSTLVIRGAPSTSSRVHSAVTANRSGGAPSSPSTSASAIAKQLAWAPAISSSGLVLPSGCLVREAHVTASSSSALLPLFSVPAPRARDPSHWTSASRRAIGMVGLPLRMCAVSEIYTVAIGESRASAISTGATCTLAPIAAVPRGIHDGRHGSARHPAPSRPSPRYRRGVAPLAERPVCHRPRTRRRRRAPARPAAACRSLRGRPPPAGRRGQRRRSRRTGGRRRARRDSEQVAHLPRREPLYDLGVQVRAPRGCRGGSESLVARPRSSAGG